MAMVTPPIIHAILTRRMYRKAHAEACKATVKAMSLILEHDRIKQKPPSAEAPEG